MADLLPILTTNKAMSENYRYDLRTEALVVIQLPDELLKQKGNDSLNIGLWGKTESPLQKRV